MDQSKIGQKIISKKNSRLDKIISRRKSKLDKTISKKKIWRINQITYLKSLALFLGKNIHDCINPRINSL